MEMLEELEKDFNTLVNKIDFKNYDPLDPNFMKASVVGLMWLVGGKLCCCSDVEEELSGAKKYFQMYEESGDAVYKTMANDELRHAETLIKKHLAKENDITARNLLYEQEKKRLEMVRMVTSATIPVNQQIEKSV